MQLSAIIPIDSVEAAIGKPLRLERLDTNDQFEILSKLPDDLYGIAASTWNRIVTGNQFSVDAKEMATYFSNADPKLALAIEKVIGRPMIKEFGFLRATVRRLGKTFVVATSSVAHLFSDELHFYDIAMANPKQPLPNARRSDIYHHRGFGLLGEVMKNVFAAARERNCSVVTLTAGERSLVEVFSRHGFRVEENAVARSALSFGFTIPMEARV